MRGDPPSSQPSPLKGEGAWIPAFAGMTGGVNPGPIWPCLAPFTPSGEAGNEATVASFGTPLTRIAGPAWPCFDCGGLITSGQERQTLNSVAFGCIWLHFLSSEPSPSWIPAFAGMAEGTAATRRRESHPRRGTALRSAEERQPFNSVPFCSISFHSSSPEPSSSWIPAFAGMTGQRAGMRGSRLRGNDEWSARE